MEGEDAVSSGGHGRGQDPGLSSGQWEWLNSANTYTWTIDVPFPSGSTTATTTFNLFARTQSSTTPFDWKINGGASIHCDSTRTLDFTRQTALGQFIFASWVWAGSVDITNPSPGVANATATVTLTLNPTNSGALDALVLISVDQNFAPRAQAKPDELFSQVQSGYFPFQGRTDQFDSSTLTSATDMSGLNEAKAGDKGRIVVQGDSFVHSGTGEKVKFWAINLGSAHMDQTSTLYLAKQLKKMGVNLVRFHSSIYDGVGSDWATVDNTTLYDLFFLEHALKQNGIYLSLSIFWFAWVDLTGAGYAGNPGNPYDMLFFNSQLQDSYKSVWQTLLTTPNPYEGGLTFAQDPAVAFASVINEDSLLWYDLGSLPAGQLDILMTDFGNYFKAKYGSLSAGLVVTKYGASLGTTEGNLLDDPTNGLLALRDLWTSCNVPDARGYDTLDFLTQQMKTYYASFADYLKTTLGFQGLVHGSNWFTICDKANALDKYANLAGDWLDRHGYYGMYQTGSDNGYSFTTGDTFVDQSALYFKSKHPATTSDYSNPFNDIIYNGLPSTISEVNWESPNVYRADFPLIAAAYGSLQGTDAIYLFAGGTVGWQQQDGKFSVQVPIIYSQFPLAAYVYRNNLISEGDHVVQIYDTYSNLVNLQMPPFVSQNFSAIEAGGVMPGGNISPVTGIDPLSFYVGKVEVDIDSSNPGTSFAVELSPYIDRTAQTVTSKTGQLKWDYKNGVVTVNAPSVQAVTGFLSSIGGGSVTLNDITIQTTMDYGTVWVVAVDGQPLSQSSNVIISISTENRNYNWSTSIATPPVQTINSIGWTPIMVKNIAGSVTFTSRNDFSAFTVTALDENGYPTSNSVTVTSGGTLTLLPDILYYQITTPTASTASTKASDILSSFLKQKEEALL